MEIRLLLRTYLLIPHSTVLLEKLTGSQSVKKFPIILWNPKVHYRIHKITLKHWKLQTKNSRHISRDFGIFFFGRSFKFWYIYCAIYVRKSAIWRQPSCKTLTRVFIFQTLYRAAQALRVSETWGSQISRNRHMKVVRSALSTGRLYPPLPRKYSWY